MARTTAPTNVVNGEILTNEDCLGMDTCPLCGQAELNLRHGWAYGECVWYECDNGCGFRTDPD